MEKDLSIYVHIPFCVRKCNYCDFLSFCAKKDLIQRYFEALKKEIILAAERTYGDGGKCSHKGALVRSIFFGGGTPSFVDAELICDMLQTIRSYFDVKDDAEISIEVNPASAIMDKLLSYRKAGFNRISIGAQSLDDGELKMLGRVHDGAMFYETYENAKRAGFTNINVDVMSALPNQSLKSYVSTLQKVIDLKPEHISAYSLIVEEGTPFFEMDLELPDEDTDRAMYHETKRILGQYGYHRYEISNYAKEGCECQHNKVYWRRGNYLGLGIGAASMVDNRRWSNTRDIDEYIRVLSSSEDVDKTDELRRDEEVLSKEAQMEEFMFLGLRLVEGVSPEEFRRQFGCDIDEVYGEVIKKYVNLGLLEYSTAPKVSGTSGKERSGTAQAENVKGEPALPEETFLRLTESGLDVSNTVMAEFLL